MIVAETQEDGKLVTASGELQWGRDLIVAETTARPSTTSTDSSCFNGAAT